MKKKAAIFFLLIVFGFMQSMSQNCVDYGEFDDSPCNVCAPAGWSVYNGAPEIDNVTNFGWCPNLSESPTGGTMVGLDLIGSNGEGIETTVSGLTPGVEHTIQFWFLTCDYASGLNEAILEVIVDGTTYEFDSEFDWTLIEICIVPSSSDLDIILTGQSVTPQAWIFLDDAQCETGSSCCALLVNLEEEDFACPNEDLELIPEVENIIGSVTYTWTSSPSNGVDYLSDPTIPNPIFNYTNSDIPFEGDEFVFTLEVEDDNCVVEKEITITVQPIELPSFPFETMEFCENEGLFNFPTRSSEGISGTWETTSIFLNEYAGMTFKNIFHPDPSSVPCPLPSEHCIEVTALPDVSFELPDICESDPIFVFPDLSIEEVLGEWDFDEINPLELGPGTHVNSFTPDLDFCFETLLFEYEILPAEALSFSLPDSLCIGVDTFFYPEESQEGIEGYWELDIIDSSYQDQLVYNTFYPTGIDDDECYFNYSDTLKLIQELKPSFDLDTAVCRSDLVISLNNLSLENYVGTWNVSSFRTDTISENSISLYWTSDNNINPCVSDYTHVLNLLEPDLPDFDLPAFLCSSDPLFAFDTISIEGIIGTWESPSFNPSDWSEMIFSNTFTPHSSFCAIPINVTIEVNPAFLPQFDLPDTLCAYDANLTLPENSLNGIQGSWSPSLLIPSDYNNEIFTSSFTPSSMECSNSFELNIYIEGVAVPDFDLPDYLCEDDDVFVLPILSDNGILGQWSIPQIDPTSAPDELLELDFIPQDDCSESITATISIVSDFEINATVQDPQDCDNPDGVIILDTPSSNIEYSIDNGQTWGTNNTFQNLQAGIYDLLYRDPQFPDCIFSLTFTLNNPSAPSIDNLHVIQIMDCDNLTGSVTIITTSNNLEFSIDGGLSWQDDPIFDNLTPAIYNVVVRDRDLINCTTQSAFEIFSVQNVLIEEIDLIDISDCDINDGQISILATGNNLEYSIDGGLNWSLNNTFTNLEAGNYTVIVRNPDLENCLDEATVQLAAPNKPEIRNVEFSNPKDCHPLSGVIEIFSDNTDIEYSIDGGISWSDDFIFMDLEAGIYNVVIRDKNRVECTDEVTVELISDPEQLDVSELEIINPSVCDAFDGIISVTTSRMDLEYSIDGGQFWQALNVFQNLPEGDYYILIREIINPDCNTELNAVLVDPECPCNDLDIQFETTDIICLQGDFGGASISEISGFIDPQYDVLWSNNSSLSAAENLSEGWHFVTITYDENCEWVDSIFINQYDPLTYLLETFDPDCEDSDNGQIQANNVMGGIGQYLFSLNGQELQSNNSFINLSSDEYELLILDSLGCLAEELIQLRGFSFPNNQLSDTVFIKNGQSITLNPLINTATIDSFYWTPQALIDSPQDNIIISVSPEEITTYTLELFHGECIDIRTITVVVQKTVDLYISNIISLNDPKQNTFFVQSSSSLQMENLKLNIYDRWGNLIFLNENLILNQPQSGWDGHYNHKPVDLGVYVYLLEYTIDGETKLIPGTITVIR